ncbi:hypothetical protein [Mycobacterium sp.]|uniref:hypothetical protein n=1 Tax=Mycobacterium sp. TaxID=1785 RepID=UPI003BABC6E2
MLILIVAQVRHEALIDRDVVRDVSLADVGTGASAVASRDRLVRLEQINQHVIDAARSALAELGIANDDMARIERRNAAGYSWPHASDTRQPARSPKTPANADAWIADGG